MVTPALVDLPGVSLGHSTLRDAQTGCTVIRFDQPALTAVDVRGAAPGSRELDLLAPGQAVQAADAILLTGGSAFGLRAAEGVMAGLQAIGRGYPTPAGPVPIVPAAVIFDLAVGSAIAPTVEDGRRAFEGAVPLSAAGQGVIGAGAGATWGAISGTPHPGGVGIAQANVAGGLVTAIVVLNAFGSVSGDHRQGLIEADLSSFGPGRATSLMCVITDVPCDHDVLLRMSVAAHDALARKVIPAHTLLDGDIAFASTLSRGTIDLPTSLRLCLATELAMETAIDRAASPESTPQQDRGAPGPVLH